MSVEVLTGVLVIILAVATTAMLALGVAGAAGVVHYLRCEQCHRLSMVSGDSPTPTCVHCQHERLLHPMAVRHRAHAAHHPHG